MKTHVISAALAAILALTPMASGPARAADTEDVLGVIIGLGALYAIGRAIEDDNKKKSNRHQFYHHRHDGYARHYDGYKKRRYEGKRNRVLSRECLRTIQTRQGPVRGFGLRCIERTERRPGRLPSQCLRSVRSENGIRRNYFAPRCLRRAGWEFTDRPYVQWRD